MFRRAVIRRGLGLAVLCLSAAGSATADTVAYPRSVHPGPMSRAEALARSADLTELGRSMFFDPSLSASGAMACSTCHDPAHGYGPPGRAPIVLGGPALDRPGVRAVPSLRYLQAVPAFTEHFHESEDEADESVDAGPTGGLTWDGRVDRARDQAKLPLLSPLEMANASPAAVVAALTRAVYADRFRRVFGDGVFDDPETAFDAALDAIAAFEQSPPDFYPYSSRFDGWLAGRAALSDQELRGYRVFMDETRGNCDSCHPGATAKDGTPPQFSDFGLVALGAPRNAAIPANADPRHVDLGLCGPDRTDFADRADYCGRFRAPTLRNVALRTSFFHNGVFHDLREAVAFYATRDTDPGHWYPRRADGTVDRFDDLPEAYRANVETGVPFGGAPGDRPRLDDRDVDDIVAFLKTLTDADLSHDP